MYIAITLVLPFMKPFPLLLIFAEPWHSATALHVRLPSQQSPGQHEDGKGVDSKEDTSWKIFEGTEMHPASEKDSLAYALHAKPMESTAAISNASLQQREGKQETQITRSSEAFLKLSREAWNASKDLEKEKSLLSNLRIQAGIKPNAAAASNAQLEKEQGTNRTLNMKKGTNMTTHMFRETTSNGISTYAGGFCKDTARPACFFADYAAVCYEESKCAEPGTLEEVLLRKKVMTTMYKKAFIFYGVTCEEMGYTYDKKPHPCYTKSMTTVFLQQRGSKGLPKVSG